MSIMNVCPGYVQVYRVRTQPGEAKTLGGDKGGADTRREISIILVSILKGSPHWTGCQAVIYHLWWVGRLREACGQGEPFVLRGI